jgi:hypothetical protein
MTMGNPRSIKATDIVSDIYSGVSRRDLMHKYDLTRKQLRSVLEQLVDAGSLAINNLTREFSAFSEEKRPQEMRAMPRIYLDSELEIFCLEKPEVKGSVSDISEIGLGTKGISAKPDDPKNLVVIWQDEKGIRTIEVEATCRWSKKSESSGEWHAGFRITKVSGRNLTTFRRLFELIPFEAPESDK